MFRDPLQFRRQWQHTLTTDLQTVTPEFDRYWEVVRKWYIDYFKTFNFSLKMSIYSTIINNLFSPCTQKCKFPASIFTRPTAQNNEVMIIKKTKDSNIQLLLPNFSNSLSLTQVHVLEQPHFQGNITCCLSLH